MVLAQVWHYWIAVAITVPAILLLLATVVGYLVKVSKNRYPSQ